MVMHSGMLGTLSVAMTVFAAAVSGQNYPDKPIHVYAPQAGTGVDLVLRMIADAASAGLGQRIIVDNRGILAAEIVARAPPDGYSLVCYTNPLWLMPLFGEYVSWDPVKDFSPISLTVRQPNLVVVHPSVPAKSIKELIALAKARPGELNYASTTTGNANHVAAELFNAMAGVRLIRINYKGGAQAAYDVVAGHVQVSFSSVGNILPYVQAGKLRALAVTTAQPSPLVPGLPTVAAAGLPGYESTASTGVFAPARTPAAIISRLNRELVQALDKPNVKERLAKIGIEVVGSSPEQLATTIKVEMTTIGKVIKDFGLREKR